MCYRPSYADDVHAKLPSLPSRSQLQLCKNNLKRGDDHSLLAMECCIYKFESGFQVSFAVILIVHGLFMFSYEMSDEYPQALSQMGQVLEGANSLERLPGTKKFNKQLLYSRSPEATLHAVLRTLAEVDRVTTSTIVAAGLFLSKSQRRSRLVPLRFV